MLGFSTLPPGRECLISISAVWLVSIYFIYIFIYFYVFLYIFIIFYICLYICIYIHWKLRSFVWISANHRLSLIWNSDAQVTGTMLAIERLGASRGDLFVHPIQLLEYQMVRALCRFDTLGNLASSQWPTSDMYPPQFCGGFIELD